MNNHSHANGVSKWLRQLVHERDSYTCVFCEQGATDVHHVTPRSRGGRNRPGNLVSLCRQCHDLVHGNTAPDDIDADTLEAALHEYLDAADSDEYMAAQYGRTEKDDVPP
jgi:5-methylcytosine-specific restriction endonuclease McrA